MSRNKQKADMQREWKTIPESGKKLLWWRNNFNKFHAVSRIINKSINSRSTKARIHNKHASLIKFLLSLSPFVPNRTSKWEIIGNFQCCSKNFYIIAISFISLYPPYILMGNSLRLERNSLQPLDDYSIRSLLIYIKLIVLWNKTHTIEFNLNIK